MSFYIKNITRCSICEEPIASFKEAILLPYIADQDSPLVSFVKSYAHRTCFDTWEQHDDFVQSSFEQEGRMIQKSDHEKVILYDRYCIINYKKQEDSYRIRDCYSIFEIRISLEKARKLGAFFENAKAGMHAHLEFEKWIFTVKTGTFRLLIIITVKSMMRSQYLIPESMTISSFAIILNGIMKNKICCIIITKKDTKDMI